MLKNMPAVLKTITFRRAIVGFVISFLFLISYGVSFAENEQYQIDKEEEQCMSKDYSTAGMNNCTYAAQVKWDAEMNKYYLLLMKRLKKEEGLKLKEAQRAWIKFRDKEFEFIDSRYFNVMQGTMYTNIAAADKMSVVKDRALNLKAYYKILTIDSN